MAQAAPSDPDQSARINVGTSTVNLEGWDRRQLERFFKEGPDRCDLSAELMAHSIAMVLKTTFDVERLKKDEQLESSNLYALQAELMLDTALGMALLDETQNRIDTLVLGGGVADAKAMSQFRHQIIRAINAAKQRIADSEIQQAEALSTSLGDRTEADDHPDSIPNPSPDVLTGSGSTTDSAAIGDDLVEPVRKRSRRRARPAAVRANGPSDPVAFTLTRVLALWLAVTFVFFLMTVVLPVVLDQSLPPMLRSDLTNPEQFVRLVAKGPSIYVTIDSERWAGLDEQDQRRTIDNLGLRAGSAGYSGVLLSTSEGQPVARWLEKRGYELIQHPEESQIRSVGY